MKNQRELIQCPNIIIFRFDFSFAQSFTGYLLKTWNEKRYSLYVFYISISFAAPFNSNFLVTLIVLNQEDEQFHHV